MPAILTFSSRMVVARMPYRKVNRESHKRRELDIHIGFHAAKADFTISFIFRSLTEYFTKSIKLAVEPLMDTKASRKNEVLLTPRRGGGGGGESRVRYVSNRKS